MLKDSKHDIQMTWFAALEVSDQAQEKVGDIYGDFNDISLENGMELAYKVSDGIWEIIEIYEEAIQKLKKLSKAVEKIPNG